MTKTYPFRYPDIPQQLIDRHFSDDDQQLLVVGVLGKSHHPTGNKMSPFDVLQYYAGLDEALPPPQWPCHSDITFYFQPPSAAAAASTGDPPSRTAILYMHFVSPDDAAALEHLSDELLNDPAHNVLTLAAWARTHQARHLLLAIQVCHIVVLSEPSATFDTSQLAVFKALRTVRDRFVVPQLAAVLRSAGREGRLPQRFVDELVHKDVRLCPPRFLFYFECGLGGGGGGGGGGGCGGRSASDDIKKLEFEVEDKIYKMLRHDFVITNNLAASLFSIPRNKRFVYMRTPADGVEEPALGDDPLLDALSMLEEFIEAPSRDRHSAGGQDGCADFDDIRPYRGFGKPLHMYEKTGSDDRCLGLLDASPPSPARRSFMDLLREHIADALENGFDDSCSKFRGKSQFLVPSVKGWFDMFTVMHELFVGEAAPAGEADAQAPADGCPHNGGTVAAKDDHDDGLTFAGASQRFRRDLRAQLDTMLNTDVRFIDECAQHGVSVAVDFYMDMLPNYYSRDYHNRKSLLAYEHMERFARLPDTGGRLRARLQAACDDVWNGGRRQCELLSLRGNPCTKPAHTGDQFAVDQQPHTSTVAFIAACNCGRTQGRRDDPYTVRQANHEFYQLMAQQCAGCQTTEQVRMPVFEPSVRDFRAAAVVVAPAAPATAAAAAATMTEPAESTGADADRAAGAASPTSQISLLGLNFSEAEGNDVACSDDDDDVALEAAGVLKIGLSKSAGDDDGSAANQLHDADTDDSDSDSINEILINCHERDTSASALNASLDGTAADCGTAAGDAPMRRQPSTVEYLPGMVHTASPAGLLPQFASWSLVCIGPSSVYSHSGGLPEHVQAGFLNGSNVLLPWDVHVRLEHAAVWAAAYTRHRHRSRNPAALRNTSSSAGEAGADSGQVITLKVFIGCEYECVRGHRFFMATPERVLRNGLAGLAKDSGTRVVFNDMPLYVACPCRSGETAAEKAGAAGAGAGDGPTGDRRPSTMRVAQLMRVHIVTPKAPVNVIVDPRVRVGTAAEVFVMGLPAPPRLTQSSYWVLRLPYVYQTDGGEPLRPPRRLVTGEPLTKHGRLEAAMFGVSEIGADVGGGGGGAAGDAIVE